MTDILMPKLSDTMTEGILGVWLKNVGEQITKGDIIAEVETDKATMELESFASGILLEQRVTAGQTVPVGTVIGVIGEQGEMGVKANAPATTAPSQKDKEPIESLPPEKPESMPQPVSEVQAGHRLEVSAPVVRRQARELGIDINQVQGSGPGGRVLLKDLDLFAQEQTEKPASETPSPAREASVKPDNEKVFTGKTTPVQNGDIQPRTRMRTAIAHTVSESWRNIPHFTVTSKICMDKVEEIHRELKNGDMPVSINDMIIKATALSLQKFMLLNSSYTEENVNIHREINIGIMVSIPDGILVPAIKDCQSLPLKEIAAKSRELAEQARSGVIKQSDMVGGTFSISNLGMFGVNRFSAIILPSQTAILAVGAIVDEVMMSKAQAVPARVMEVTLSADHRVVDGVYAAGFLRELKLKLENPMQILL